jgi:SAM-dependent methyltransferase
MQKRFLHVGCGPQTRAGLKGFDSEGWEEIRYDIDANVDPDLIGTLTDMRQVEDQSVDAVYSSHNIEHVFAHEVPTVLSEFHRVLRADGIVVITCPDLQSVCAAVAKDKLLEPLYTSPAGPISAIDILYGHRGLIAGGNAFMAHKCGFTLSTLQSCFLAAGFANTAGGRRPDAFDIWLVAFKAAIGEPEMLGIAARFLP